MMVAMPVDHAGFPALAVAARAVFVTARAMASDEGIIEDRRALGDVLDLGQTQLRFWLGHLEQRRWQGRALAQRRGARELWVLLADIPSIPPRRISGVVDVESIAPPELKQRWRKDRRRPRGQADAYHPGEGSNPEFRWLRARMGGLERALAAAQAKNAEAAALLAKLDGRALDGSPAVAAMRADLLHAADCGDPDCERCVRIVDALEDADGPYATEREVSERIARGTIAERAGRAVVEALRRGERQAVVVAVRAVDLVLAGDVSGAERALKGGG
jgi:hypothetical protein